MLKELYQLLFIILFINFSYSQEKLYYVGHAYGNPSLKDQKLDPSVLNFLKNETTKIVYGGDFIYDANDETEIQNFLEFNKKRDYVLIPGNHDVTLKSLKHQKNRFEIKNKNLFLYLNTNFKHTNDVQNCVDFVSKTILKKKFKNILIFTHQLIYSKSNFDIRTNSRDNYQLANLFYDEILEFLIKENTNIFIYSGDIGGFKYTPYCYFNKINKLSFYASGLGNDSNNYCIEIKIDNNDNVSNLFIDLNTSKRVKPERFSLWKVRLYQLPKLILYEFKLRYKIFITVIITCFVFTLYLRKKYIAK